MKVYLCERVNDLRHSFFHLLNCLITTASELREWQKVTGSKVWTIGMVRNCLDTNLGQIVCGLVHCPGGNTTELIWRVLASSDGISCWTPLKPQHSIPCWLICSVGTQPCQCCPKKGSSKVCGWIYSVWPSWVWESRHASTGNSVSRSLGHSSRSVFHRKAFFPSSKQNFIAYRSSKVQIAFLKFTCWDNQALVGCIPIAAVAVHLNLKS